MVGIDYGSAICLSVDVKSVPIRVAGFASMIFPRSPARLQLCATVPFSRNDRLVFRLTSHLSNVIE